MLRISPHSFYSLSALFRIVDTRSFKGFSDRQLHTKIKNMKNIVETLGIDLSKSTLDAFLHVSKVHEQFENNRKGFQAMLTWARKTGKIKISELLTCFEHTGIYGMELAAFLEKKKVFYCMVPALEIKKSLGMVRGKNDRVDAQRIAEYAHLRRDTIKETKLPSALIQKMKKLIGLRSKMVRQRAGYMASLGELKRIYKRSDHKHLFVLQENIIKELTKSIDVVEAELNALVKSDEEVYKTCKLLMSIKGIGPIVAYNLIVVTHCFRAFENSRQLACYCGLAPFSYQSGTSLKSKAKVSNYADKGLKALLTTAANSAVGCDAELRAYTERRLAQNKSKMSTLNIIRNKLLHRAFAVIKRGTPFVETYHHKVANC